MSKVEKLSNLALIKVVYFFIQFDKKFVRARSFFHAYLFFDNNILVKICKILGPTYLRSMIHNNENIAGKQLA